MPRFLVPIDGSESANRALNHAIDVAKKQPNVVLHLLTIHPEPILYGEIQVYVSLEKMRQMQVQHCQDLLKPAVETANAAGVPFESEILSGEIAPTIVRRANELKCDAIVMGTRGMTAIGNLTLGSVATKVIHLTGLPVTLVK